VNPSSITPLILTYNEEPNIGRCLERLRWAPAVVVVDSGSTDRTVELCGAFGNVRVVHRAFDDHTSQWNFGLDACATEWVLALDSDYLLPESFAAEITALAAEGCAAYFAAFRYVLAGRPLRGALYPPRAVLFSRLHCRYEQDGHTQSLRIAGSHRALHSRIDHDDRKPLSRWLDSQRRYAALEVEKLAVQTPAALRVQDRLRRMIWPAAPAAFFYTLFAKGLIFDGWPGLYYALQRTYAELLLSLELLERRTKRGSS
jgi:glycosyltransferase involved in cell wall biosynthesis